MAEPAAPRQIHRQRSALVTGSIVAVIAAFLTVLAIVGGSLPWALAALAAVLLAVGVFVRPSVQLDQRGVHLINPVRTTALSWPSVDLVESRWNLKVCAANGKDYGSWAVSAQRAKVAGATPSTGLAAGLRLGPSAPGGAVRQVERRGSAGDVAERIMAAKQDYERAVQRGAVDAQEPVVRTVISPLGAALVVGGVICALGAILLG